MDYYKYYKLIPLRPIVELNQAADSGEEESIRDEMEAEKRR